MKARIPQYHVGDTTCREKCFIHWQQVPRGKEVVSVTGRSPMPGIRTSETGKKIM